MCAYCCQNVERQVASVRGNNAAASLRSLGVEGTRRCLDEKKKGAAIVVCSHATCTRIYDESIQHRHTQTAPGRRCLFSNQGISSSSQEQQQLTFCVVLQLSPVLAL
jgi:hypothetical protein